MPIQLGELTQPQGTKHSTATSRATRIPRWVIGHSFRIPPTATLRSVILHYTKTRPALPTRLSVQQLLSATPSVAATRLLDTMLFRAMQTVFLTPLLALMPWPTTLVGIRTSP